MLIHSYQDTATTRHVASFNSGITKLGWAYDMHKWCVQTFGPEGVRWSDQINYGEVIFTNESDLALFLLRWS